MFRYYVACVDANGGAVVVTLESPEGPDTCEDSVTQRVKEADFGEPMVIFSEVEAAHYIRTDNAVDLAEYE